MSLQTFLLIYVAACGLIVGSYLNVVIHRLPRGESTVFPHSRCPSCGLRLRPWHNIPLLSFALLRARCARCRSPISWRYPLVEALMGLLFVGAALRFGWTSAALVAAVFAALMVVLTGIDLEYLLLPDRITLPWTLVGLLLHWWVPSALPWASLSDALLGVVLGAGSLLALSGIWFLVRKVHGMGLGDVKMLALVGAFLGWKGALITVVVAAFSALPVLLVYLPTGRLRWGHKIPFGPFLAFGAICALFFGGALMEWYGGLLWGPAGPGS